MLARDYISSPVCVHEILSLVLYSCARFYLVHVHAESVFLIYFLFVMSTAPSVANEFLFLAMNVRADWIQVLLIHA